MRRSAALLFLLGATVGSGLDALHTYSGTTAYAHVLALRMAWWTPLLFGFAGLSVGLTYPIVERITGRAVAPSVTPRRAAAAFGFFAALYAASGFLPASNPVKLAVLVLGAFALLVAVARTPIALGLACVTAVAGPTVEVILVSRGAFQHLQPDLWGVPIWLPALYAAGSVAFGTFGRAIAVRMGEANRIQPA